MSTEYVKSIVKELGLVNKLIIGQRDDLDFFDCLGRWGVPLIGKYRWCMHQFKLKVIKRCARKIQVTGIRNSDSHIRAKIKEIDFFRVTKSISVNPIISFRREDVIAYIRKHGVEINPCYEIYGHSGNCMFCPYHSKKQIILTLQDPTWREKILQSLVKVKGKISRKIAQKWIKWSKQTTLTKTSRSELPKFCFDFSNFLVTIRRWDFAQEERP